MDKNLAFLSRPETLKDFVCEDNKRILFESIIENQDLRSFIFYGRPGSGKTTISYILANELNVSFDCFNAAIDKKEDLVTKIKNNKIVIIDEIHRLNKDKQDILLPYLENGLITIYATTTENPYFKLNPALRSRCTIIELSRLEEKDISNKLLEIAKNQNFELDKEVAYFLATQANGDFRAAINLLELVLNLSKKVPIDLKTVKTILPSLQFASDEKGDEHYNYLSAFHKSLRGSDWNAALYWGFIIVKSGDFDGLFRRMICATYEDVGLANSKLAIEVMTAINAFERLGMPEGYLPIANAILLISLSPKSNSAYLAAKNVNDLINQNYIYDVPNHLKDAHYKSASKLGRGINYLYPHDFENHYVFQQYLPDKLLNFNFYKFGNSIYEQKVLEYWKKLKKER
ncbi:replication-associated recombination protein A [Mycoplasma struthionis]|uniref:Replication-associated recombination protein A n=1 Tax=Mycoplasma struthionis TaxID=538220 RepID=A0A3G8LJ56_9MOLU|nr:replication-associated recombination protein A [Mycoplasma struthionis]AZG68900.1 replication-associated recombination protein A [Mycoplasma struthionis]TPI01142.1 replication-associated recombination protein A [Mycoplasma struthionis]